MAFVDSTNHNSGKVAIDAILSALLAPFRAIEHIQNAARLGERAAALLQLSDAQLAARGLKREEVVSHVFGGKRAA